MLAKTAILIGMTKLRSDNIRKLGELARIGISEEVATTLSPQLTQILNYVEQLQSVNTDNIKVTSQVTELKDIWRQDEVRPSSISRDELLKNTPYTQDGYIKVRRVL